LRRSVGPGRGPFEPKGDFRAEFFLSIAREGKNDDNGPERLPIETHRPLPMSHPASQQLQALVACDADGVLLDYNPVFAACCEKALGVRLTRAPGVFHHFHNEFNFPLSAEQKATVRAEFAKDGWRTMPEMAGAVFGAQMLARAGHRLVCVSSMPGQFQADRHQNLLNLGMPFESVTATGRDSSQAINPKAAVINALMPTVFVEDQLRNFEGVDPRVCRVFIDRQCEDADHPDAGLSAEKTAHFSFDSLLSFAQAFVQNPAPFFAPSLSLHATPACSLRLAKKPSF